MPCAWSGTISELKSLVNSDTYVQVIASGFESIFQRPSESEQNAWRESIHELCNVISDTKFDPLHVIIELQMPVGAERADVILLGGTIQSPSALVIELKQWAGITVNSKTHEVYVPGMGVHQHPSIQVLNYRGKLKYFNSRAHNYLINAVVYIHNASTNDLQSLSDSSIPKEWLENAPIYTLNQNLLLADLIEELLLPCNLDPSEHQIFTNAPYEQSNLLFSFLQTHAKEIAHNAALAIANCGMGLTTQQDLLISEIFEALSSSEKKDFIIQGGPGSGKTLMAVSLLLKAAENKNSCIFAIRNNRLMKILRSVLDQAYPGVSVLLMFFKTMNGKCLYNFHGTVDLLICDEAQRIDNATISCAPRVSRVSAIFLDETQRLNPPEYGTVEHFSQASQIIGKTPVQRELSASVRCYGGAPYHAWVESLLSNPADKLNLKLSKQPWRDNYIFEVWDSIDMFVSRLSQYKSKNIRVAMVASFTESPGKMNNPSHSENLRIGYPLTSGFSHYRDSAIHIPWLMSPDEYAKFWLGGTSNKLDMVASIYGTQGFESDYVGVIWGRDLVYRDGKWSLGNPNYSFDTIDRLINGRPGFKQWNSGAFDLIVNRYRIFLTRGIRGTLVYCEDDQTREYLLNIQKA